MADGKDHSQGETHQESKTFSCPQMQCVGSLQ